MLIPVILTGGTGTRLWPLSREAYPKQFIALNEGKSLFQETLLRLQAFSQMGKPIVLGNEQHRFLIAEQIRQSSSFDCDIILEPCFKNTAPAVALAAMHALKVHAKDVLLLVLPADHAISSPEQFVQSVEEGCRSAAQGKLVTFGVVPTHPETGYGYIQKGVCIEGSTFHIERFVEKPSLSLAKKYVDEQTHWWNSGLFLFSAKTFLQALLAHEPAIYEAAQAALAQSGVSEDFIRPAASAFEKSPANSIDYAIMEKTQDGVVIPLASHWNDVGAWDAFAKLFVSDEEGNVKKGDVVAYKTRNCFLHTQHRLVVTCGVENLFVIETDDALLILDKKNAQDVKAVVQHLKENDRKEIFVHRRVNRPWGAFESIDKGERFQVKHITVAVGGKLSLQRHQYRSEHWVVVKGTARVTRGEEVFFLGENQSTYIPIGVNHRLENAGEVPLEIIEVQSGAYLGEDDIVRLEDHYGRLEEVLAS